MQLLDGLAASQSIKQNIKKELEEWISNGGKVPHLATILIGNNKPSRTYVNNKSKQCKEVGFEFTLLHFDTITDNALVRTIEDLNNDDKIDGILVQLPLPSNIDTNKIVNTISPKKDVDCFHPLSLGKLMTNTDQTFWPATPYGILMLLEYYQISVTGKHCVIVGRSNLVGTPLALLLSNKLHNATVTVCHSKTPELHTFTQRADILIVAMGKARFVEKEMVKPGAIVIDVGINDVNNKIVGDVDFENVAPICSFITPVPRGVGPMTISALLKNTLLATKLNA